MTLEDSVLVDFVVGFVVLGVAFSKTPLHQVALCVENHECE